MRYAGVYLSVALPDVVGAARPLLHHLRLIGGGGKRERRPGEDELHRVVEHLAKEYGQIYADVVAFGAVTAMRRGEEAFGEVEGKKGMKGRTGIVFFRDYWGEGRQGDHIDLERQPADAPPVAVDDLRSHRFTGVRL